MSFIPDIGRLVHRVALVAILSLVVGACGEPTRSLDTTNSVSPAPTSATVAPTPDVAPSAWWQASRRPAESLSAGELSYTMYHGALDEVVYPAEAVVEARIESVAGPFWNQGSGQFYEPEAEQFLPMLYREVELRILAVVEQSSGPAIGERLTVLVFGSGGGGAGVLDGDGPTLDIDAHVMLFLVNNPFLFRENIIDAWQISGGTSAGVLEADSAGLFKPQFLLEALSYLDRGVVDLEMVSSGLTVDGVAALVDTIRRAPAPERLTALVDSSSAASRRAALSLPDEPECLNATLGRCG